MLGELIIHKGVPGYCDGCNLHPEDDINQHNAATRRDNLLLEHLAHKCKEHGYKREAEVKWRK